MKHLCCNKIIIALFLLFNFAYASLQDKSAVLYYGENISYPMVGVHDYIIVQPDNINTYSHGFSVYKDKMYAYVSIGEIDKDAKEYAQAEKSWMLADNKAWNSKVMDIKDPNYQEFLFDKVIKPEAARGFENFFFDTLDSYRLAVKTEKEDKAYENALVSFINKFHERYPKAKLIINRGFNIIDKVHNSIQAVLFESYYRGIENKNLGYAKVSDAERKWLDKQIKKVKSYGLDVIAVDYLPFDEMDKADTLVQKIKTHGLIPYVSNRDLNIYGRSSKNALKREILTLIDESQHDRINQSAHQYGALPLEYMGYIQQLRNVSKEGLPKLQEMSRYAGVIVWLSEYYKKPDELIKWAADLKKIGIKIVFADSFGIELTQNILNPLGIKVTENITRSLQKNKIVFQDKMMGFEMAVPKEIEYYVSPKNAKPLLRVEDANGNISTTAAITPWGGYALGSGFMTELDTDNIWVIDPFKFFAEALDLKPLIVPDTTTENGDRILFSHADGDGIMNIAEWNPSMFSGESLYENIFTKYKIPISVSIIGAEVEPDGLYPKISQKLVKIAKKIYALSNIEGASHTFSHPFFWGKIKDGDLEAKYRLNVPGYDFSIDREILGSLNYINTQLMPKNKPSDLRARTIYWTGECIPPEDVLDYVYRHGLLNINGGDTTISNSAPWQSLIAPLGLERGDYYQIYTGAQNENVYTNNWNGPFWGYKKAIQTFKLTNSPRRFKPIDIYFHLFSGEKRASLNALKDVFDWATKQDVFPIFTSQYILKAMDYYTASIANEGNEWLFAGMKHLHTLRLEKRGYTADLKNSKGVLGFKHFEDHTYYHLDDSNTQMLDVSTKKQDLPYLIDANAKMVKNKKGQLLFKGYMDLKLHFNVPKKCKITSIPVETSRKIHNEEVYLTYKNTKEATIDVSCR
ncbi:endo alpha-1,4 polygalactosaminidase [Sulfurimonas sp. HSL-1716]|uniref:endo alpha-1,4 polygalactosaminidase n=1 Tax=Hydrocurvibacter sulfurireducens TaxID=3131937 RepID=UPI0031F859D7